MNIGFKNFEGGRKLKPKKVMAWFLITGMLAATAACSDAQSPKESASSANLGAAAEEPFGKYSEPVTISICRSVDPSTKFSPGKSVEDNQYVDVIKNDLNIIVKYEWVASTSDFDQKMNLAISANDLPDAAVVNLSQYDAMAKYGEIADLTDVYDKTGCDIMKHFYESGGDPLKKLVLKDGRMMSIPATTPKASGVNEMWIRQDWLKKLNLSVPKNMEELENVAKAFVEKDPDGNGKDDTIGIIGPSNKGNLTATDANRFGLDPLFQAYQSFPGYWLKDANGDAAYGSIQPETKDALQGIAKLYQEGLIDPQLLVRSDSKEPVLSGKAGIFFSVWDAGYTLSGTYKQDPPPDWQAYAYPQAADGKYYAHMAPPASSYMVVNKDYAHPEAAVKIVNLLLRDQQKWVGTGVGDNAGPSGAYPLFAVYDNVDEIETSYQILSEYVNGKTDIDKVDFTSHKLLKNDMEAIKQLKKEPYDDYSIEYWDRSNPLASSNLGRLNAIMVGDRPLNTDKNIVTIYSLYYGRTETMESKWSNLQKLESETFANIIMGRAPIDSFDTFVTEWKNQGGSEILKEIASEANQ